MQSADYLVNMIFNFDGGTYTYDNADALHDSLRFRITGADIVWPDIVKQVSASAEPLDPSVDSDRPQPQPVKPLPCVVSGSVFYEDGGIHSTDPVEGVDVYIYIKDSSIEVGHTVTDEKGSWKLDGLASADYAAVFSYLGNASHAWTGLPEGSYTVSIVSPNATRVLADKSTTEPDSCGNAYPDGMAEGGEWVWNTNANHVRGVITDTFGEPIQGARIAFTRLGTDSQYVAVSGADGSYGIGLAPGRYGVTCAYNWDAAHTFFGGSLGYIDLTADKEQDFTIARSRMTISVVRDADGSPAAGAEVKVSFQDGTLFDTVVTREDGDVFFQGQFAKQ